MGRLLCCISISIAFFDENPFKQRKTEVFRWKKNSQETHRRDRFGPLARSASHHAACVSLPISYDVKQRGPKPGIWCPLEACGPVRKWRLIQPPNFPSTTFFRSSAVRWNHQILANKTPWPIKSRPVRLGVREAAAFRATAFPVNLFFRFSTVR